MDKGADENLTWKQTMQLRMHTKICDGCAAYQKQSTLIEKILNNNINFDLNNLSTVIENKELQKKIISKL